MCVTTTLSNEELTKIKVLDLDEFYNFYIHNFFSLNHLGYQNLVWTCHFLKFKFWIVETLSDEEMTKIKVVNLDEYYNFYVHDFHLKSFGMSNSCLKLSFLKIQNLSCSHLVTWKHDQNKSCRSWWVLQLLFLWLF